MTQENKIKKYFELRALVEEHKEEMQDLLTEIINDGVALGKQTIGNTTFSYVCSYGVHFSKEKFMEKYNATEEDVKALYVRNAKPSEYLKQ